MPVKKQSEFEWPEGGGLYLSEAEKDALIDSGAVFKITGAEATVNAEFGDRAEWDVLADGDPIAPITDGGDRKLAFARGAVESRDRVLFAMVEHFAQGKGPIPVRLELHGRVKLIVPAVAATRD